MIGSAELAEEVGPSDALCLETRAGFSSYLDGALDGHTMVRLARHLDLCPGCAAEFAAWRSLQSALGDLGPALPPQAFQARVRDVLASEIGERRHLSPLQRAVVFSREILAPAGLRFGAGFAATLALLSGAVWFLGTALPVQANDDHMAHLNAPRFLYAQQPTAPISSNGGYAAVLVDAKIDKSGRVYDYDLLDGPRDPATRRLVESNLLESVFKPATVFGEPVPGHVMMMFTSVSARG